MFYLWNAKERFFVSKNLDGTTSLRGAMPFELKESADFFLTNTARGAYKVVSEHEAFKIFVDMLLSPNSRHSGTLAARAAIRTLGECRQFDDPRNTAARLRVVIEELTLLLTAYEAALQ